MEVENMLAKRIGTAGENAPYDNCCKKLLASKQILAWILKTCVLEFKDCSVKEIEEKYIEGMPQVGKVPVHQDESAEFIEGTNTEDVTITEGTVRFDIRFWAVSPKDGERIRMLINVESQNKFNPGYPVVKRGIYYCSRMISGQRGTVFTGENYGKIRKVYSIWVCARPPKYRRNTITEYSMQERNLVGEVTEDQENFDVLTVLVVCLGGSTDKNYEGLLKMLDVLLSSKVQPKKKKEILQNEFDIAMTKTMETEAMEMCNLSQGIVDETLVNAIISMMRKLNLSEEECMEALEIPEEQRESYHMMLEDEMAVSQS